MSLRIRMGVAAGIAVAIAVIAVTVSAYAGTRSQLRNQVDTSLRTLSAQAIAGPRGPGGPEASPHGRTQPGGGQQNRAGGGQQNTGNGEGTCEGDEGLGLDRLSGPAFGGAPGIYTLFNRCGGTFVPTGQGYSIPSNSRIQTLARSCFVVGEEVGR